MIQEDYVSFEVAKLLKEKGFDVECQCCYTPKGYIRNLLTDANNVKIQDFNSLTEFEYEGIGLKGWYGSISAPTTQMAMKWLREVHKWSIQVFPRFDNLKWCYDIYELKIQKYQSRPELISDVDYDTYEEACEVSIRFCLKNLI